ncbi:Ycf66 protein [Synechococcus sp. PCC 7502]|uniref:Ycf66 family protein n=1 Tax=Synechococcus sp. PCC 7502 TaxID=1173263 RepID=UPI00029FC463|nr:Ycf66 family protein [Synechococcus sp. PCC 7502]AFY74323.1 Ycf66 protein [Synechococcus sp. PCC 7502]
MINIGGNPLMILLAIIAALGGIGLYFVRSFRPELARDHDIFFSAIALVYGIILLAFNFRMEITTQLAQVLVVGFAGWFAVESLILRQALSAQARRSPMNPIEDDPIDPDYRGYRAEIDPNREFAPRRTKSTRQMRGTSPQQTELRGDVEQRKPRRPRRSSDAVIDIDEDDIRPIAPKSRRPKTDRPDRDSDRPTSPSNESPIDSEWNRDVPPRRPKRPRNSEPSSNFETDEQDW